MEKERKRIGRPPGSEFPTLLHVRISKEMADSLDEISSLSLERPATAHMVREALADYIIAKRREIKRKADVL